MSNFNVRYNNHTLMKTKKGMVITLENSLDSFYVNLISIISMN